MGELECPICYEPPRSGRNGDTTLWCVHPSFDVYQGLRLIRIFLRLQRAEGHWFHRQCLLTEADAQVLRRRHTRTTQAQCPNCRQSFTPGESSRSLTSTRLFIATSPPPQLTVEGVINGLRKVFIAGTGTGSRTSTLSLRASGDTTELRRQLREVQDREAAAQALIRQLQEELHAATTLAERMRQQCREAIAAHVQTRTTLDAARDQLVEKERIIRSMCATNADALARRESAARDGRGDAEAQRRRVTMPLVQPAVIRHAMEPQR